MSGLTPEQLNQLSADIESAMHEEQTAQVELNKLVQSRAGYAARLNENTMVKEEFDLLDDDARVFKLIGPALVLQDVDEAKQNVEKRLEYITAEMGRLDGAITAKEGVVQAAQKKVAKLNQKAYQMQLAAQKLQQMQNMPQEVQQKKINA
ncbi:prefoldin beta subunit [Thecamonas trahens ATCC 50062]|uniref:Prefoldin beta subunit n=1 Tax=Thecamonas trahens ATCC 50062 TaxID=461836 RepID=A0A0L0D5B7_THETB|nr:prefoldin beta subunit [Thecamonas trahens ATCC 50062]KNC46508.1 prefoldin beta subunit [Thecamonas trahens ATCC 50062]|eukprot:XP_013760289.1 prefoldin beta subunit [Thecamonas trahens ATCC 50062]